MLTSLNDDNLDQAVDYLNKRIFKYEQSSRAYKISLAVWSALYVIHFFVFSYGAAELLIWKEGIQSSIPVISALWRLIYESALSLIDANIWYWFIPLFIIPIFVLPIIVGFSVRGITNYAYKPDVSSLGLSVDTDYLITKLSQKSLSYRTAKYVIAPFRFCWPFAAFYILGVAAFYLYTNWNDLPPDVITVLAVVLLLAILFFLFVGLMILSYKLCEKIVVIKDDYDFPAICANYSLRKDSERRNATASPNFDIAKYRARHGGYNGGTPPVRPKPSRPESSSVLPPFDNSAPEYNSPYVSVEQKIQADNAYLSGKMSPEEYNKISEAYWEHHPNDEHWPDVGDG